MVNILANFCILIWKKCIICSLYGKWTQLSLYFYVCLFIWLIVGRFVVCCDVGVGVGVGVDLNMGESSWAWHASGSCCGRRWQENAILWLNVTQKATAVAAATVTAKATAKAKATAMVMATGIRNRIRNATGNVWSVAMSSSFAGGCPLGKLCMHLAYQHAHENGQKGSPSSQSQKAAQLLSCKRANGQHQHQVGHARAQSGMQMGRLQSPQSPCFPVPLLHAGDGAKCLLGTQHANIFELSSAWNGRS